MNPRAIYIYRNANPVMRGETLVDPHGRPFPMVNEPFLAVELYNYPRGRYQIELTRPFKFAVSENIKESLHTAYLLDPRFMGSSEETYRISIRGKGVSDTCRAAALVHTVSGAIRGFDGKRRQAYVWMAPDRIMPHPIIVRSDRLGKFAINVPQGKKARLFVNDASYGKETLENWIMTRGLSHDVVINPRIGGQFEFYELNAWQFDNTWNIFFLPAVVDAAIPPALHSNDVSIQIDGKPARIGQFTPHRVSYRGRKRNAYYPAYLMSAAVPREVKKGQQHTLLKLSVDSKRLGKGEAWFIHDRTAD